MKTLLRISVLFLIINMGLWISPHKASAMHSNFSFQLFYDQLSPYGTWVNNPDYGYVWLPDVDAGFSPYATNGHWEFTDYGWTWVSDYVWGWAPFHYGRWYNDPFYGPMWVPDNEWGPAWVTWRRADGYFGWTPMTPGININVTFGRDYYVPSERWIFVRDRDFCRHDINRYYMNQTNNYTIINNSTVINNTYMDNSRHVKYVTGPDRNDVQRRTNSVIRPLTVRENDRPGQSIKDGQFRIYRPVVTNDRSKGNRPAPAKVTKMHDVKSLSERNADNRTRYEDQSQNKRNNKEPIRNANREDNQRQEQPVRKVNNENNQRQEQPARNVSTEKQRNGQPARNVSTENNQRQEQPARKVNTENNLRKEQPSRNERTENNQRQRQPARNESTENKQQNVKPAQNVRSSEQQLNERQPAQSTSRDKKRKENVRNANNEPK